MTGLSSHGIVAGGASPAVLGSTGIVDLSSGTWQNLGNVSLSMGPNSLLIVPSGSNAASFGFANPSVLGLTHTAGTTLIVAAGQGFGGVGSIADPVACQGSILAATSGGIDLSNTFSFQMPDW